MKRESKVYSFEDQKWDARIRLELQRRKQAAGIGAEGGGKDVRTLLKEAKLTPKQQVSK